MITAHHKEYETLIQNLELMSCLTDEEFKELGNRYYARVLMHKAKLAIEELNAYKNSLNLYFVAFSKHEGQEWTCHAGFIFAKKKEDIEPLLNIECGTDVIVRSAESLSVQEGTILYGERWKKL